MSATTSQEFIAAKGYDYEGIALNVYATHGEEGWEMCAVKLVGSDVDLIPMLSDKQIDHFDALVERREMADNAEARFDRALERIGPYLLGAPM